MSALSQTDPTTPTRPGWYLTLESYLLDPDRPAQSDVQAAVYAALGHHDLDTAKIARLEDELTAVEVRAHHAEHRIGAMAPEMCMSPVGNYSGSAPEMCALPLDHGGRCRP
jgi:hypothetical protein